VKQLVALNNFCRTLLHSNPANSCNDADTEVIQLKKITTIVPSCQINRITRATRFPTPPIHKYAYRHLYTFVTQSTMPLAKHLLSFSTVLMKKKRSEEKQTLRAGFSKAEPKFSAPPQTTFQGSRDGQNLNSCTFTYKPSLVRTDARNFELSW